MRASGQQERSSGRERRGRRLLLIAILLIWLSFTLPLALGSKTLYYRDVFTIHLPFKAFGAQQLVQGRIPAFNPTWGLGQPYRGNPNALAFYPGNLLYLALPFWSAFNLHYALHWLLAFFTMRALARELGQGATGSLMAGLSYAGCGWMLSNLSFYNLLTVAAWWPLVLLGAARGGRRGVAVGGIACGLALLGGEPVTAALGLLPLLWVAVSRKGVHRGGVTALAIGALGLAIALPQVVATARILDFTYRGGHGLPTVDAGYALHPVRVLELLMPLPFGTPSELGPAGFWATRVGDKAPFFSSLHLGVVGLILAAVGARRHPLWALLAVLGLAAAWLGGLFPEPLVTASGGLFRYPEKFITWFALSAPLLAGWGLEASVGGARRGSRATWVAGTVPLVLVIAVLLGGDQLVSWLAPSYGEQETQLVAQEQIGRWLVALLAAAVLFGLTGWAQRRQSGSGLVLLQLVALLPLSPLVPTDSTQHYRQPAPWTEGLSPGSAVTMSTLDSPFGLERPVYRLGDTSRASLVRLGHLDLDYPTGVVHGLSYPLAPDPEGMQSPLFSLMFQNLSRLDWPQRLNWMRSLGVDAITLTVDPAIEGLTRIAAADRFQVPTSLLKVRRPAPEVWWPHQVVVAPNPIVAFAEVTGADDPVASVAAPEPLVHSPSGRVRLVSKSPDRLELEVGSAGGLLVVRRAFQPLLRAKSGGRELETLPVNLNLLGVEMPPGEHRLVIQASAGPEIAAGLVALAALASAIALMVTKPHGATGDRARRLKHPGAPLR